MATAFEVPPPSPELRRLEPLIGTWTAEGNTLDSRFGPGVSVTSRETFRWLEGGYFLVQDYETTFGDEPTQAGVNYWCYDPEAERFRIIFFSNNGPFTEEGNRYEGRVGEGKLTFEGPARFEYDLDDDGAVRANGDGTISITWWLRDEESAWQPWMTNTFTKIEGEHELGPADERLGALVGRWQTVGRTIETPGAPAALIEAVDTYEWLPGRFSVLHTIDARVGDVRVEGAEIIGWDPSRHAYVARYFGSDGPNAYEASLEEQDGALVWSMHSAGDRFTGSFSDDGTVVSGHWERLDGNEWLPWMEITLTKGPG